MRGKDELQALREQVAKEQVGRIREEFESQGVAVRSISGQGGAAYMYAAGQLLVREDALDQARTVLMKLVTAQEPEDVIPGVKLIRFGPRSPASLPPRPWRWRSRATPTSPTSSRSSE